MSCVYNIFVWKIIGRLICQINYLDDLLECKLNVLYFVTLV